MRTTEGEGDSESEVKRKKLGRCACPVDRKREVVPPDAQVRAGALWEGATNVCVCVCVCVCVSVCVCVCVLPPPNFLPLNSRCH